MLSNNLLAEIPMELFLTKVDDKLNVYLLNSSTTPILFNKRFAVGPVAGPNEIVFVITNNEGKTFPFSAKIMLGIAVEKDFMILDTGLFVGRQFNLNSLLEYYELENGRYQVMAVYENKHESNSGSAFLEKVESNTIAFKVKN